MGIQERSDASQRGPRTDCRHGRTPGGGPRREDSLPRLLLSRRSRLRRFVVRLGANFGAGWPALRQDGSLDQLRPVEGEPGLWMGVQNIRGSDKSAILFLSAGIPGNGPAGAVRRKCPLAQPGLNRPCPASSSPQFAESCPPAGQCGLRSGVAGIRSATSTGLNIRSSVLAVQFRGTLSCRRIHQGRCAGRVIRGGAPE